MDVPVHVRVKTLEVPPTRANRAAKIAPTFLNQRSTFFAMDEDVHATLRYTDVMPTAILTSQKHPVVAELENLLGAANVISERDQLFVYECDGFTIPKAAPIAVIFPQSTMEVSESLRILAKHKIPVMARGGGTGLVGGTVSVVPAVQISVAKMRTIHKIDTRNRCALVDAGVINYSLSAALENTPFHYAPDPSSQRASTIGGNVATNAGGLHTLKYGVTVNHILGVELVLDDGTVHQLGGPHGHDMGPDLTGLLCGSEGTLGIVTKVWCRLTPKPKAFRTALAMFNSSRDATNTVTEIIAAGIIPAAMEMIDGLFIKIVEEAFHLGIDTTAQAMLLIEVDGVDFQIEGQGSALDLELQRIEQIAKSNNAKSFAASADEKKRADLWMARRKAFAALGRLNLAHCTQDSCVPRSKLPEVLEEIGKICKRHDLFVTNCFHAGDGNVHPALCFDENDPASIKKVLDASAEIIQYCVSVGGAVTGEHGVGIEKVAYMKYMFSPQDIALMHSLRRAFTPEDRMNPFKALPRDGVEIDLMNPVRNVQL